MKTAVTHYLKKVFALGALLLLSYSSNAQDALEQDTYYKHMLEINKEWVHFSTACPEKVVAFDSDMDRISAHLQHVCSYLSDNAPEGLNESQFSNRKNLIASLEVYAANKVFPTNLYHQERQPYFVDDYGVHCAVGHLMDVSEHDELVSRIVNEHNYDYIVDIKTEGVQEWADEHGFTMQELKWIQPGYPPQTTVQPVGTGSNNPVNDMVYDTQGNRLIISGEFTELGGMPCMKIGQYDGSQLSCLGNGLNGVIEDVFMDGSDVFAVGAIQDGGTVYPLARFDGASWEYLEIPGRSNAVGTAGISGDWWYDFEVCIAHSSIPGKQEVWHYDDSTWILKAEINGDIYDLAGCFDYRAYVGDFDEVKVYTTTGDSTFATHNVLIKESYFDNWTEVIGDVSDTIKTAEYVGSTLYVGGNCSWDLAKSQTAIARYLNGTVQPVLQNTDFWAFGDLDVSINDLHFDNGNRLLMAGFFPTTGGLTVGSNVGYYHLTLDYSNVLANPNEPANAITYCFGEYYFAGEFTHSNSVQLNHLGRVTDYNSINPNESAYKVYPNPFMEEIAIEGAEEGAEYSLTDAAGKQVKTGVVENNRISDLSFLAKGTYMLSIQSSQGPVVVQLVK